MNAIDATAIAIYIFEGGAHPTSRNVRNLNPGNLRPLSTLDPQDGGDYRVFKSFADGWLALTEDIEYKVAHHLTPASTMVDFFNLYAPGADHNDPNGYAQFVCAWLTTALGRAITISSTIGSIYV
jgi:hypothetical protein